MKKLLFLILISLFLLESSCNKKEVGDSSLTIEVSFVYGDEEFTINEIYSNFPLNYNTKIEKLLLYLSEIKLVDLDGQSHHFAEIIFVDAADSISTFKATIPAKQYLRLDFSIGVPQALNGTDDENFDAALYNPDHALSINNGMYWTWNTGYRFVRLDGRSNTNPEEDDDFETLVSIHTGKDYCFRNKSFPISYTAIEQGEGKIKLVFDVYDFLASEDDIIDIAVDNQSHGTNEGLANRFSDRVLNAVRIK
jgi:hypothetical protein